MDGFARADQLHEAMCQLDFYPHPCRKVDILETHASRLYLTETRVYKVKKPVNFGFLDFTTLQRREHFCREEVRLNRRLAPDMYHGVRPITATGSGFRLGGEGEPVEWVVEMTRLPAERMLDQLLDRDTPGLAREVSRVAEALGKFHAQAEIVAMEPDRHLAILRQNWQENLDQTLPFVPDLLPPSAHRQATRSINAMLNDTALRNVLAERCRRRLIRDGHGDLHAAHICLTEPLRIYDCIEFNDRFRQDDILSDLSFLVMDLDFHGDRELSRLLLARYQEILPEAAAPRGLLRFYLAYRAWVRGKVDALLSVSPGASHATHEAARQRARRHFNLALGYQVPPFLLLTCGLMGTGKSTLATVLAQATGAHLLRADVLRKQLAGVPPGTSSPADYAKGIYTSEMTRRTYDQLFESALRELERGAPVIVDASFIDPEERARFLHAEFGPPGLRLVVHCSCPAELALARLATRLEEGRDASDGRPDLYHHQAARFAPPVSAEKPLQVDTSGNLDYNVGLVLGALLERSRTWRTV